jgi:hypothetical protein
MWLRRVGVALDSVVPHWRLGGCRYTFSKPGSNTSESGRWWDRKRIKGSGKGKELRGLEDSWRGEVRRGAPQRGWLLLASTCALFLAIRQSLALLCASAASGKASVFLSVFRTATVLVLVPVAVAAFAASLLADYPDLASALPLLKLFDMQGGPNEACYRAVQAACQVGGGGLAGYLLLAVPSAGWRATIWCGPNVVVMATIWWFAREAEAFQRLLDDSY